MRLRMLLELKRRGTLSAVAEAFSYSTSAVSQNITQLERDFGARLIAPDGRRVKLTAEGEALTLLAPAVLDAWEGARGAVASASATLTGRVSIAAFQSASLVLIPPVILRMRAQHPGVTVAVSQAGPEVAIPGLLARDFDLAIIESYPGRSDPHSDAIAERALFHDAMTIAAPSDHPATSIADLADMDWVFESRGSPERDWSIQICHRFGFEPRIVHETSDLIMQCVLVRSGVAAAFLPNLTPKAYLEGIRLIALQPDDRRKISLAMREASTASPLVAAAASTVEALWLETD